MDITVIVRFDENRSPEIHVIKLEKKTYESLVDMIVSIVDTTKKVYVLENIIFAGKVIMNDCDIKKFSDGCKIYVSTIRIMSPNDLFNFCKRMSDIDKIDDMKIVATMKSGQSSFVVITNLDMYSQNQINMFLSLLSDMNISIKLDMSSTINKIIFYNDMSLTKLWKIMLSCPKIVCKIPDIVKGNHVLLNLLTTIQINPFQMSIIHILFDDVKMEIIESYDELEHEVKNVYNIFCECRTRSLC